MQNISSRISSASLKVAALPLDITWADRDENLYAVDRALQSLPEGTDLVVLPELFSTGFSNDAALLNDLSESNDGPTIAALRIWARRWNIALAGSYIARVGTSFYNRGFFVEPSGDETFYDKRHLFSLSSESQVFSQGETLAPVVRFRGWNIAMVICYDLRFPVWCRNVDNAYDMMLVPANWAKARGYAWEHLLIARAIENQAVVVGANRSGRDDYGDYEGMSQIYDGKGMPVGKQEEMFITATLTRQEIDEYRRRFPVSGDRDEFTLSIP